MDLDSIGALELFKLKGPELIEAIKLLDPETRKILAKGVKIAEKPVNEELLALEGERDELLQIPDVALFVEIAAKIKKMKGRSINPNLPESAKHDEMYRRIRLVDGTELDTSNGKGWRQKMLDKGYSDGQVAMVSKGRKQASDGKEFKSTL